MVHPDRVLTNAGVRPGDALILTKPLGTGVLATAVKAGSVSMPKQGFKPEKIPLLEIFS